jgi:hypothetical protein
MRSRKLLALLFCLITFPAIAGYMTLLGAGVGNISPTVSWVAGTDAFPDTSLTYSGPSLSTMFDSTGKLTYAPNNLLPQSNTFSNAAWTKDGATITNANAVADPFGGTQASTFTAVSGNQRIIQTFPVTPTNAVISLWVKRRAGSGGAFLSKPDGSAYVSIPVTGSWAQVSIAYPGALTGYLVVNLAVAGDAIDIYSATYSAVTWETLTSSRPGDQVITTASAYYGPRIDYDPNTLAVKGLLIEEARTNIVLQNRDLTNAAWTKGATATVAKDQIGIDGVTNSASSFTGGAVSATNTVLQSITLASSTRAQSAWVKRLVGSGVVNMTTDGGATWNAITLTGSYTLVQFSQAAVTNPSVGFQITTLNDKIAVDVVQNEPGTFATSSIITAAASVTRAADVVQFTGPALTALQGSAGSAIVELTSEGIVSATNQRIIAGGQNLLYNQGGTNVATTSNGTNTLATANALTWSNYNRSAVTWSASGRSIVSNGGTVATDAFLINNSGTSYLGSLTGSSAFMSGWYKSFAIYNQRLPDATLQTKSVVGASYAANDNGVRYAFADNDNLPIHWRVAL